MLLYLIVLLQLFQLIAANEPRYDFQSTSITANEGDSAEICLVKDMSHISSQSIVYIQVEDVTAVRGIDFIADSQITVNHTSGERIVCTNISIPYNDDNESDESFRLRIIPSPVNAGAYTLGMSNIATVTIKNVIAPLSCKERLLLLACKTKELAGEYLPRPCMTARFNNS
uniref:Calx-beta domain-containing protein n=1 Tax=Amphimedon queenslandica TaxID=400682 RepID=A0A1X7UNI0_AMPQE